MQQGCIGLGCVAMSSMGCFLAARCVVKKISVDPTVAKALAALYATVFGREMGYRQVIFEGDAQVIVMEVNREGLCTTRYGQFVEGIQSVLNGFESVYFTHVMREANNVAHRLSKLATTHAIDSTWL
jgi:hypothetical protein